MPLAPEYIESVSNTNLKTFGEAPLQIYLTQAQDGAKHRARLDLIAESNVAKVLETLNTLDPVEAAGITSVQTMAAGAAVSAIQQLLKGAQTTPPQTAIPS